MAIRLVGMPTRRTKNVDETVERAVKHLVPVSGKDSLTARLLLGEMNTGITYESFYNDTGMELPEVVGDPETGDRGWLGKVEDYIGQVILRIGASLKDIIYSQNFLHSHQARYCTRMAKIFPMEEWIGMNTEAYVYYGIRYDEKDRKGYESFNSRFHIHPVYPLIDAKYTLPMVWQYLADRDLLPPQFFWQDLYERVMHKLMPHVTWFGLTKPEDFLTKFKPWEQAILFAGRSRPNCHHCHYQRLYECVWLLETHEKLFWENVELEEEVGTRERVISLNEGLWKDAGLEDVSYTYVYSFNSRYSLREIASQAERIKQERVNDVVSVIIDCWKAELPSDVVMRKHSTMLDITSCGPYCGK